MSKKAQLLPLLSFCIIRMTFAAPIAGPFNGAIRCWRAIASNYKSSDSDRGTNEFPYSADGDSILVKKNGQSGLLIVRPDKQYFCPLPDAVKDGGQHEINLIGLEWSGLIGPQTTVAYTHPKDDLQLAKVNRATDYDSAVKKLTDEYKAKKAANDEYVAGERKKRLRLERMRPDLPHKTIADIPTPPFITPPRYPNVHCELLDPQSGEADNLLCSEASKRIPGLVSKIKKSLESLHVNNWIEVSRNIFKACGPLSQNHADLKKALDLEVAEIPLEKNPGVESVEQSDNTSGTKTQSVNSEKKHKKK